MNRVDIRLVRQELRDLFHAVATRIQQDDPRVRIDTRKQCLVALDAGVDEDDLVALGGGSTGIEALGARLERSIGLLGSRCGLRFLGHGAANARLRGMRIGVDVRIGLRGSARLRRDVNSQRPVEQHARLEREQPSAASFRFGFRFGDGFFGHDLGLPRTQSPLSRMNTDIVR